MQNLHLADNSNLDKEDKFAKVKPLIDKLNEQCLANYLPEQSVSIDESMVPYFGRHGCKPYMRSKPVKSLGSCDPKWVRHSVLSVCWKG